MQLSKEEEQQVRELVEQTVNTIQQALECVKLSPLDGTNIPWGIDEDDIALIKEPLAKQILSSNPNLALVIDYPDKPYKRTIIFLSEAIKSMEAQHEEQGT